MSETKRKRIELETTAKGDRFWLNETREKRMLAILGDLPLIIKHAEHGPLKVAAEKAMEQITCVAIFYNLLAPETVSEDAPPEIITGELAEQSPPKVEVPNDA